MKEEEEVSLVYHLKHGRPMPGCLPLFVLLAGLLVVLGMELVQVRKPEPLRPRGEGNVYYRNDELLHFHVLQRSPLPLRLPAGADPAQAPNAGTPSLTLERQVELLPAPAPTLFSSAPDSAVLNKAALLELPPAETDVEGGEREGYEDPRTAEESEEDGSSGVSSEVEGERGSAEGGEGDGASGERAEGEEPEGREVPGEGVGSEPGQETSPMKEVQP